MRKKIKIGVLVSGGGSNLQAIIDGCEKNEIDGQICFVGSDNPEAKGLERAEKYHIPVFVVNYSSIFHDYCQDADIASTPSDFDLEEIITKQNLFSSQTPRDKIRRFFEIRAIAESRLLKEMASYSFDLLVLAGFMRILSPYIIDRINIDHGKPRIMNIHPALLPAFPGGDGYGETYRYGCKVGGCTVHFVDYGEDTGPIIGQKSFEIFPDETLDDIRKKGLEIEWQLYPKCIQLFAENRLEIIQNIHFAKSKRKIRAIVKILPKKNKVDHWCPNV
jgi:phosphoribosylglycinamide formyltransferase 1